MDERKGPGINLATSEVFETSDLTEADQHYFPHEETVDSIEPIHVSISEAFGRFKGACVDNKEVDFSDKIRNSRRKGYIVWKGEEGGRGEEETPVKKYQRLNCEVRELLDEIAGARTRNDPTIQTGTLETLAAQADILHKHLLELRLEDVLGKEVLDTITDPQAAARVKLMSQLKEIKSLHTLDASRDKANTKGAAELSYNLMLKPDTAKLQAQSRVATLTARISGLEKIIGTNTEDLSILSMETGRKTLTEAVSVLSAKTTILEPKNLDHIEGRLAVLQQKMGEDEGLEGEEEDQDALQKVREVTKVSDKAGLILAEVPDLIDRMEALNPLHTQAAEVSQSLVELEAVQQQLLVQLSNNSGLLKEIQNKFQSNLASIDNNFKNLHARIQAVQTKK